MTKAWRDPHDGFDWRDGGDIEVLKMDGTIVKANLFLDAWDAGDDEIPVPVCKLEDGTEISLFDQAGWRQA